MSARGPIGLIIRRLLRWNLFKGRKSSKWFTCLGNCNGSPNKRTDPGCDSHQSLVEQRDFLPTDVGGFGPTTGKRWIGTSKLKRPKRLEAASRVQMCLAFTVLRCRQNRAACPAEGT